MAATSQPSGFLPRLREDLIQRRIQSGLEFLESRRAEVEQLDAAEEGAARILGYLAQWVDIGFASPALIESLLARFPQHSRTTLPLIDYVHLRMAEGLVAMASEDSEAAIRHFEVVSSIEDDVADAELLAIANFWIARSMRREGRYDDALSYAARAAQLARDAGCERTAAVIRTLESWLEFQKGRLKEAAGILAESETALAGTEDYATRGNIYSAHGRIARRQGKYARALAYFEKSIAEYRAHSPRHRNLARALANIAFVRRQIAVQLQRKVDRHAARRKSGPREPGRGPVQSDERGQIERLRTDAFAELDEAFEIYTEQQNRHGLGAVHLNRGFLCLDHGELDRAAAEATEAFRIGEERRDNILLARARLLQCVIENAEFEEQIESSSGPGEHARLADEYARDAVEYARHTQNRRLLARTLVWQGLTLASDFFANTDAARQCCDAATALLKSDEPEQEWEELRELKARILRSGQIETALQEWSQGLVGGKTFQQLTEEFAAMLIPKVWEREGRKVSRVATKLSVSPKKVRRVLQAAGLVSKTSVERGT